MAIPSLGSGVRGCTPFEYTEYVNKIVYLRCQVCEYEWSLQLVVYKEDTPKVCPLCTEAQLKATWIVHDSQLIEYHYFIDLKEVQLRVHVPDPNNIGIVYGDTGIYDLYAWSEGDIPTDPGYVRPDIPDIPDVPDVPDIPPIPDPEYVDPCIGIDCPDCVNLVNGGWFIPNNRMVVDAILLANIAAGFQTSNWAFGNDLRTENERISSPYINYDITDHVIIFNPLTSIWSDCGLIEDWPNIPLPDPCIGINCPDCVALVNSGWLVPEICIDITESMIVNATSLAVPTIIAIGYDLRTPTEVEDALYFNYRISGHIIHFNPLTMIWSDCGTIVNWPNIRIPDPCIGIDCPDCALLVASGWLVPDKHIDITESIIITATALTTPTVMAIGSDLRSPTEIENALYFDYDITNHIIHFNPLTEIWSDCGLIIDWPNVILEPCIGIECPDCITLVDSGWLVPEIHIDVTESMIMTATARTTPTTIAIGNDIRTIDEITNALYFDYDISEHIIQFNPTTQIWSDCGLIVDWPNVPPLPDPCIGIDCPDCYDLVTSGWLVPEILVDLTTSMIIPVIAFTEQTTISINADIRTTLEITNAPYFDYDLSGHIIHFNPFTEIWSDCGLIEDWPNIRIPEPCVGINCPDCISFVDSGWLVPEERTEITESFIINTTALTEQTIIATGYDLRTTSEIENSLYFDYNISRRVMIFTPSTGIWSDCGFIDDWPNIINPAIAKCMLVSGKVPVIIATLDEASIEFNEMFLGEIPPLRIEIGIDARADRSYPPNMDYDLSGHNMCLDQDKSWYDCDDIAPIINKGV